MRNWYNRKYLVLVAPVAERRGHTFELKLSAIEDRGFRMVGTPTFIQQPGDSRIFGVILMQRSFRK